MLGFMCSISKIGIASSFMHQTCCEIILIKCIYHKGFVPLYNHCYYLLVHISEKMPCIPSLHKSSREWNKIFLLFARQIGETFNLPYDLGTIWWISLFCRWRPRGLQLRETGRAGQPLSARGDTVLLLKLPDLHICKDNRGWVREIDRKQPESTTG